MAEHSHSGEWKDRHKMGWATWKLGALLCLGGGVGLFFSLDTGGMISTGAAMITLVVGIMVAGKVAHDRGKMGLGNPKDSQDA